MISTVVYCDGCGTANPPRARYCFSCGQPLADASRRPIAITTSTRPLVSNHLLQQRYRIINQVGRGGFGAVYKAEDTKFGNRLIAVKEMSQGSLNPQESNAAAHAFKREALLLGSLIHPNLPRIHDHFYDAGHWYLVMDFIEGETLEEHLDNIANIPRGIPLAISRCLPVKEVLEIAIQLCTVLDYLHTRQPPIIFRDLKPANIMLTSAGHIYLIDFGIARHFKPGELKDTMALGSPGYAAPEQYGKEQTTHSADIYALGATLHHLLSGTDPAETTFQFAPLRLSGPPILSDLETLIFQMVNIDKDKRPASIAIIKHYLQRIATLYAANQTDSAPSIVAVSPASQLAAAFAPQGTTYLTYRGHSRRVLALAWAPDGTCIASASDDETVQVWDASTGNQTITYRSHSSWVKAVAWSPDGKYLVSAGADTTVQVWNAATGRTTLVYRGHPRIVTAVAWSPDGKYIASASYDQTVQVWDAFTGEGVFTYHGHAGFVNALAWHPIGCFIASASDDTTVHIWSVAPRRKLFGNHRIYTYRGHSKQVLAVAWSPNAARIASGSWDNTVQLWDAARADGISSAGEFVFTHSDHTSWVNAVAWSPNSTHIASASNDKTVQVWEASTGREVFSKRTFYTYNGHSAWVRAVAWSPDGERIASASHDKTVQVWQAI